MKYTTLTLMFILLFSACTIAQQQGREATDVKPGKAQIKQKRSPSDKESISQKTDSSKMTIRIRQVPTEKESIRK